MFGWLYLENYLSYQTKRSAFLSGGLNVNLKLLGKGFLVTSFNICLDQVSVPFLSVPFCLQSYLIQVQKISFADKGRTSLEK